MSYQLQARESVTDGVRRIAVDRIDRALEALDVDDAGIESIHDARKRFKEVRALLRLVRGGLGKTYRLENTAFRDLGRRLSLARDAEALVETFDKLSERFPDRLGDGRAAEARQCLVQRIDRVITGRESLPEAVTMVREALVQARARASAWELREEGFDALEEGLHRIYRDGRRRMDASYADGSDEHFHEWRKRIKDHWYHTQLLRPAWEPMMAARQGELKALSDLIGDDHDLSVLRHTLADEPQAVGSADLAAVLAELAAQRQGELRARAAPLGARIYAEKPGALTRRLRRYWTVWQAERSEPA